MHSGDLEQFYSGVVWEKNVFACKSTGSFNGSCHLNNSISSSKKDNFDGEKTPERPKASESPTKLLMNVLLVGGKS